MLFNSFSFLIFFPAVFLIYYALPDRFRKFFLLVASCFFYMSFVPWYILILFFLITLDYFLGRQIEQPAGRRRLFLLILSIIGNLGTLFVFKYFNFFNTNLGLLAEFLHWNYQPAYLSVILPLGLSFHVFQSLSYVIEVYRRKVPAERNFFSYALYVMFFPQLVAGPIERPGHLLPQFKLEHSFDEQKVIRGLERMLWGFFKKLVIADQIAVVVNKLYGNLPTEGPVLILLVVLFGYQLYCDFSGYSDIAVGSALCLGYDITENFNRPYAARGIADFWRRWHISLSSWLKDYLYYPLALGFGKLSKSRLYLSLFITFVLIGLWHGPNWTFVAMGAAHGLYLVFGSLTEGWRRNIVSLVQLDRLPKVYHFFQTVITFGLVALSWVFFRSADLPEAFKIISNLGNHLSNVFSFHYLRYDIFTNAVLGVNKITVLVFSLAIIFMEIAEWFWVKKGTKYFWEGKPKVVLVGWSYALIFLILFFGYFGNQPFIYFQF